MSEASNNPFLRSLELGAEIDDWQSSGVPFGKIRNRLVVILTAMQPSLKSADDKKDAEEILSTLGQLASADDKARDAWSQSESDWIMFTAGQVCGFLTRPSVRSATIKAASDELRRGQS